MAPRPKEVKRKLDELYWKTDELRKDLIGLHNLLVEADFFNESKEQPYSDNYRNQAPPPPVTHYAPPVVPPVMPPVVPPVVPPQQQPQVIQERKPQPQFQPQPVKTFTPPPPPPPKQEEKSFLERYPDLEKFIGERLITFIGIAVLVTGIAFFVKYAIDKNWIPPAGRTAIGILAGGVLLGFAHRLRKAFTVFSSVLAGGGIAVLYFAISYSFQVYHLFPQEVAFGLLVVVTGFTVLLSIAYDRKELAVLALVGGFTTPLMVATGQGNFNVLCTYMLILDLGMLALAYYKKWHLVNIVSYGFTVLLFTAALLHDVDTAVAPHYTSALVFATLFYFTFFVMNVINNLRHRVKFNAGEVIALLSNSFLYYSCGYFVLHAMHAEIYQGLFTLMVALFNFGFAFALFRRQEVDRTLVYFLIGLVVTFVSLAGPVQLEGNHITLFWAAEAALLYWLWQRSKVPLIRIASMLINGAMLFSLGMNWFNVYVMKHGVTLPLDVLLNKGFVTGIFAVASLSVTSLLLRKETEPFMVTGWETPNYRSTVNVFAFVLLFFTGLFELYFQLQGHNVSGAATAIYISGYIALYLLASWMALRPLGMEYLRWTAGVAVIVLMVAYVYFPHYYTLRVRNEMLLRDGAAAPFLFHYLATATLIVMALLVGRQLMRTETRYEEANGFYLWLMCFFFVFVVSAEIDHFAVLQGFQASADFAQNPALGNIQINELTAQSHKILFPIAWGICSFIMIAIGMRKRVRQLRIIALVLFFVAIVKLILLGIYGESQAGKIIAFILCGVILLLVSFMYQKLKKMIMDDDKPSDKNESHESA